MARRETPPEKEYKMNGTKKITGETVKNYLNNGHLMPEFQRGTSWTATQYTQLLNTILSNGIIPSFAIGTITGSEESFIIDGRQRTEALLDIIKKLEAKRDAEASTAEEKSNASQVLEIVLAYELVLISKEYASPVDMATAFTLLNNGTPLTACQRLRPSFKPQIIELMTAVKNSGLFQLLPFKAEKDRTKTSDDIALFYVASLFTHLSGDKKGISTASTTSGVAIKLCGERSWTPEAFSEIKARFEKRLDTLVNALTEYADNDKLLGIFKKAKTAIQLFLFTDTVECDMNSGNVCDLIDLLYDKDGKVQNTVYKIKEGRKTVDYSPIDFLGGDSRGNDNGSTIARANGILNIWNADNAQPVVPKEATSGAIDEAINNIIGAGV